MSSPKDALSLVVASRAHIIYEEVEELFSAHLTPWDGIAPFPKKSAEAMVEGLAPIIDQIDKLVIYANGEMHEGIRDQFMNIKGLHGTLSKQLGD